MRISNLIPEYPPVPPIIWPRVGEICLRNPVSSEHYSAVAAADLFSNDFAVFRYKRISNTAD